MNWPRSFINVFIIVLILLFAAARPYGVLADDETPPASDSSELVDTEPTPPTEDTTYPEEETPTPAEILQQLPEGTDLVVLDEDGEAVPLVTEQAAEIVVSGDPVWCPDGQAPTPGLNNCSPGFTSMADLITWLGSNGTSAAHGTIWIEDSYQSSINDSGATDFTFAGDTSLTDWSGFSLTVQGGWNGAHGDSTVTGTSEFNAPLVISNWGGNVTLNDLIFYQTGGGASLSVETDGNVILDNVEAIDNGDGTGADIRTNNGTGTVTVNESRFNDNLYEGLFVDSAGEVTLTDVYANRNGSDGVSISTSDSAVSISGGTFNSNGDNGIYIESGDGNITIEGLDAQENYHSGLSLHLENGAVDLSNGVFNSNGEDGGYGLYLDNCNYDSGLDGCTTTGSVTLANLIFMNNSLDGASIDSGGDVDVTDSVFTDQYQDGYGLYIPNAVNVTLTDILADWNNYGGVYIDADNDVTVTRGVFNNNDGTFAYGLEIHAGGETGLINVEASGNEDYGVYALVNGDMSVDAGVFNNNGDTGLFATTGGGISLNEVQANQNDGYGADLNNCMYDPGLVLCLGSGNVSVTDSEFNYNGDHGLSIYSAGNVEVDGIRANGNNQGGLFIDNCIYDGGLGLCLSSGTVDVQNSEFNNNDQRGLDIYSNGDITLASIVASFNGRHGASLFNYNADIFISNSAFNVNAWSGLAVETTGNLSLENVSAGANGEYGGYLEADGTITDSGSNYFNYNTLDGTDCSDGSINGVNDVNGSGTWANCYGPDNNVWFAGGNPGGYLTIADALTDIIAGATMTDGILHIDAAFTPYLEDTTLDGSDVDLSQITQIVGGGSGSTLIAGSLYFHDYSSGFLVSGLSLSQFIEASNNAGALSLSDISVAGLSPSSSNSAGIDVDDHDGSITLDGVNASGVESGTGAFLDNIGSSSSDDITVNDSQFSGNESYGLVAYSNGNITLADVIAGFNADPGASLDTCIWNGTACDGSGWVDVEGSEFDYNKGRGLGVSSGGDITLAQISGRRNSNSGAQLNAQGSSGIITVNAGDFSYNLNDGDSSGLEAYMYGDGYFSLEDVIANANGGGGAYLVHEEGGVNTSSEPGVRVTNGQFNYQYDGNGLYIDNEIGGDIELEGVTANGNWTDNAYVENCAADSFACPFLGNVSISDSVFHYSQQGSYGLSVRNYALGDINLTSVNANSNLAGGIYLFNDWMDGTNDGVVTINTAEASNNATDNGIYIYHYENGNITLTDVIANANGGNGAYVQSESTDSDVSVDSGVFNNNNNGIGLEINSARIITLTDITAINNASTGVDLDNTAGTEGVAINGTNEFSHNGGDGLYLSTSGEVELGDITASANQGYGAYICDCNAGVTISGVNVFNGNSLTGLYISTDGGVNGSGASIMALGNGSYGIEAYAYGDITLSDLTASNNLSTGVLLDNCLDGGSYCDGTGFITLTGTNIFNANGSGSSDRGLDAASNSDITVDNVTAGEDAFTGNSGAGIYLHNNFTFAAGNITINGGGMQYNGTEGLYILSAGDVYLYDVYADNNDEAGAFIENDYNAGYQVTIDTGSFNNNQLYDGLSILSAGNVFVIDITANDNARDGAFIDNDAGTGTVEVQSSEFNANLTGYGLNVETNGEISGSDIEANDNDLSGALLYNHLASSAQDVTLTGDNTFNGNGESGLDIQSQGTVTLNNVTARNNTDGNGVIVDNTFSTVAAGVSLTGTNAFTGNDGTNLEIWSHGAISLNNITAEDSVTGDGVYIDNRNSPTTPGDSSDDVTVTITGTNSFTNNYVNGLVMYSEGTISIENVTADDNQTGHGAYLDNSSGSGDVSVDGTQFNANLGGDGLHIVSNGTVDVQASEFNDNEDHGLNVATNGAITGADIDTNDNGLSGALLYNQLASSAQDITLTGDNTFNGNGERGLDVRSQGVVSLNNVIASNNTGSNGLYVDNKFSTTTTSVSLTGTNAFIGNQGTNLAIWSHGAISLNNITAEDSATGDGAYLDNLNSPPTPGDSSDDVPVMITGTNSFTNNYLNGLFVFSEGVISIEGVTADDNQIGQGAYLNNTNGSGNINVDGTQFNSNTGDGLHILSKGMVTLANLTASYNGENGAYVDNCLLSGTCQGSGVVFVDQSNFNSNDENGIAIASNGNITLTDVIASLNDDNGAYLVSSTGSINIDPSTFSNNQNGYGLYLNAGGNILLSEVTADGNDLDGAFLSADGNANVICSQFNNNGGYGVHGSNVTGTLTFEDVILTGNSGGPFSGSPLFTDGPCAVPNGGGGGGGGGSTPSNPSGPGTVLLPVTGGAAALDCTRFGGTTLTLPNGDSLTFLCPIQGSASASTLNSDGLPSDLPDGTSFVSAITGGLSGGDSEPLPGKVIISFDLPDGLEDASLAILFWNGSEWVELHEAAFDDGRQIFDPGHITEDGHFEASTNFTGIFVLVSK